jgi:hypothetical protein
MHARVTTIEASPDSAELGIKNVQEKVIPAARELEGYQGGLFLLDRRSGKMIGITLWATQEAMRATESRADELRSEAASDAQGRIASVERFEVIGQA